MDVQNPLGLVEGDASGRLFRGSGSSQAAAVVSGAAAVLLQYRPSLTPDEVKTALVATARPITGAEPLDAGAGQLDLAAAYSALKGGKGSIPLPPSTQTWPVATGLGSLEAARGGSNLYDAENGAVLQGEVDVQGDPWDPAGWRAAEATGSAWDGGAWLGARWSGDSWSGARWSSSAWEGAGWSGAPWSDASWTGARWSGARWSAAGWSSSTWDGARWSDSGWS